MKKLLSFFLFILFFNLELIAMEKRPYHHLPDGTFRNPEGSPERDPNIKWSYKKFNTERKKIDINFPKEHVVPKNDVLKNLEENKNEDFLLWVGHATFIMKLGQTTIVADPLFSDHTGPFGMFGPKRYVDPAIRLNEVPKTDLLIVTHDHYDHLDLPTIKKFPHKESKVIVPLNMSKYFNGFNDVNELDWYDEIVVNKDIKVTLLSAVHWGKRTPFDTNKKLWGNFLIQYKDKKILFCSDTGYGKIYKELGNQYGPIDLTIINIGAYDFKKMGIEKSIYHTTPEEALEVARDLRSKKVIGMHWGTVVLSLEPIMEPAERFKAGAEKYGFKKDDAIIFKIGEVKKLNQIIN